MGDAGPPGTSTGTAVIHLVDQITGADIVGATVTVEPSGAVVTTNVSGRATFADVPIGLYRFTATTPGLVLSGSNIVAGSEVSASTSWTSVLAGATAAVKLEATRFSEDAFNLTRLHTAATASYVVANCHACHGDRRNELSAVPTITPFHSMGAAAGHASLPCVVCHARVDVAQESGATLRKQVSVQVCTGCHSGYPNVF